MYTCKKCGGFTKKSKGIMNFHDIRKNGIGEFFTKMLNCFKCIKCGHSFIPKEDEKAIDIYRGFEVFCDGVYDIEKLSIANTYSMGVTKIKYYDKDNVLHVYLRRPGLLIGKGGSNIDSLQEYIGCKIHIHEVRNLWD